MSCVVGGYVPLCGTSMLPRPEHVPGNEAQWGFQKEKTKKAKTTSAFWRTQERLPCHLPFCTELNCDNAPVFPGLTFPTSHLSPSFPASRLMVVAQKEGCGHALCLVMPFPWLILQGPKVFGGNDLCHLIKSRCVFSYLLISYCFNSPSYRSFPNTMSSLTRHSTHVQMSADQLHSQLPVPLNHYVSKWTCHLFHQSSSADFSVSITGTPAPGHLGL